MSTTRLAAGRRALALVAALGSLAAACGSSAKTSASSAPTSAATTATVAPATTTTTVAPTTTAAPTTTTTVAPTTTTVAAKRTTYPVTITDCDGRSTVYAKAPERVVTIDPSITETLLVLGLKDKIAGYTEFFTPDQQWSVTKADMATLKEINDGSNYPSKEAVVAAKPDLVASVYSYAFADPLPDRKGWDTLGIHSYLSFGGCASTAQPTDFSLLYKDVLNLGVLFDVQDKAEAVVAKFEAQVAALQQKVKDAGTPVRRLAVYDGYDKAPTNYGGGENAIITLAGASYIFAKTDLTKTPSWEQFIKADPQVIWIVPDAGVTVADLEKRLETDKRFVNVTGIKNKAFVVVPQADATIESPRLIDGLTKLVDGLVTIK